jgi:hypothetical protein
MGTYSVRLPSTWHVETKAANQRVAGCNKESGECTGTGGGFPLPGVVFVFLLPADKAPDHPHYRDAHEIASTAVQLGAPIVTRVDLLPAAQEGARQCWVSRSLTFGKVWNEVYGLQVGPLLIRAWAQYNNEPGRVEGYRQAILEILSSVSARE